MPSEREKTAQFRSDMKLQFPEMENVLLQDAYKSGKKPYDFHTLTHFNDNRLPRFLAWEAKKTEGFTLNLKEISSHQMEAHKRYNKKIGRRYLVSHVFCVYLIRFNLIAILDPLTIDWIAINGNESIKFDGEMVDNYITYTSKNVDRHGQVFAVKREKVQINDTLNKTIWNTAPMWKWMYPYNDQH